MKQEQLRPSYSGGPIRGIDALSRVIELQPKELTLLADTAAAHYRRVLIPKDDGSERECWDPSQELRRVQGRLITQLLRRVEFPTYLHGSLPKRDYVTNAQAHAGARWCICLDIKSFFPSISAELVRHAIWEKFFGCPDEISILLTKLTTLDGKVPQGSLTASYLANLVLWRQEPRLVFNLNKLGLRYTRYVDDISISSTSYPDPDAKTTAVRETNVMLRHNGLVLKRDKITVSTIGCGITIMGLRVGPHVGRDKRARRALANDVLSYRGLAVALDAGSAAKLATSLRGRLVELSRYHPREAQHLRAYLE